MGGRLGGGFLVACMDRSVIQRAHTVSIVETSVVHIGPGWGSVRASQIKTRAANRKQGSRDKTRTAWPSVYEWSLVISPQLFLFFNLKMLSSSNLIQFAWFHTSSRAL